MRVLCVGDSLTEGIGNVSKPYPARLEEHLGARDLAFNLGARHTIASRVCPARARDCRSYWASDALRLAREANATHAIFLFGTNDARYTKMDKFVSEYTELIWLDPHRRAATATVGGPRLGRPADTLGDDRREGAARPAAHGRDQRRRRPSN